MTDTRWAPNYMQQWDTEMSTGYVTPEREKRGAGGEGGSELIDRHGVKAESVYTHLYFHCHIHAHTCTHSHLKNLARELSLSHALSLINSTSNKSTVFNHIIKKKSFESIIILSEYQHFS